MIRTLTGIHVQVDHATGEQEDAIYAQARALVEDLEARGLTVVSATFSGYAGHRDIKADLETATT